MYTIVLRGGIAEDLRKARSISTSIDERLIELENNPMSKAIPTSLPIIGDFYVNVGRHCMLYNIDQENKKVLIKSVVQSVLLFKVLGRIIAAPTKMTEE